MSTLQRTGLALAVAGLVVTGCGSKGSTGAETSPSSSSAASTSASATPTRSSTPAPAPATAPAVGTVLATLPEPGRVTVHANTAGEGFSVLQSLIDTGVDRSEIITYDLRGRELATVPTGGFTGECGALDVTADGERLVLAQLVVHEPAQGVLAEQWAMDLVAFDATTGREVWTARVVELQERGLGCSGGGNTGGMRGVTVTTDGAFAVVDHHYDPAAIAVDLATGTMTRRDDLLGALGASLVTGTPADYATSSTYTLTTPPSWSPLGSYLAGTGPDAGNVPVVEPAEVVPTRFRYDGFSVQGGGVSADGEVLYTYEELPDQPRGTVITAYSLPNMTELWRRDTTSEAASFVLIGTGGPALLAQRTVTSGIGSEGTTVALDPRTGADLWSLPARIDELCAISSSQMMVRVNSQQAVIDLASGRQLSYTDEAPCLRGLTGGMAVARAESGGGSTVQQLLTP